MIQGEIRINELMSLRRQEGMGYTCLHTHVGGLVEVGKIDNLFTITEKTELYGHSYKEVCR